MQIDQESRVWRRVLLFQFRWSMEISAVHFAMDYIPSQIKLLRCTERYELRHSQRTKLTPNHRTSVRRANKSTAIRLQNTSMTKHIKPTSDVESKCVSVKLLQWND